MKINPTSDPNVKESVDRILRSTTSPAAGSNPEQPVAAPVAADRIKLSDASQAMTDLGAEPFDAAKVAEIRKAISEGRFSVNAERVAQRMITESAELLVKIFGSDPNQKR